jgi:hypothetical protein
MIPFKILRKQTLEYIAQLREQGLPVPQFSPDPKIIIGNEKKLAFA